MQNSEYDVVIVGSGVAGAIVAKTLTNAGKKVLLLEAGLEEGIVLDGSKAFETNKNNLQNFYKALAKPGMGKAQALREAQLSLLKSPQYQHPYYWAPFVLVGHHDFALR